MRVQASGVHVDALMSVGKPIVIRNALVESVAHDTTGQSGPICLKLKQFSKVALVRFRAQQCLALAFNSNFRTQTLSLQHPDGVMSTPAAPAKINSTYNRSIFSAQASAQQQSFGAAQEAPAPGASVLQPAASAWTSMGVKQQPHQQQQQQKATHSAPSHAASAPAPAAAPTGWAAVAARGAVAPSAAGPAATPAARAAPATAQAAAPVEEAPAHAQAAPAPAPTPVAAPAPAPASAGSGSWAAIASNKQ